MVRIRTSESVLLERIMESSNLVDVTVVTHELLMITGKNGQDCYLCIQTIVTQDYCLEGKHES